MYKPGFFDDWVDYVGDSATCYYMVPILDGLYSINSTNLMAHVSLITEPTTKVVRSAKRVWIEITTTSPDTDENDIPIVVSEGKLNVELVWASRGAEIHYPLNYLEIPTPNEASIPDFWKSFFIQKISEKIPKIEQEMQDLWSKLIELEDRLFRQRAFAKLVSS